MPHDPYRALYIHIPFCKSRCAYCDFATRAVARDSIEIPEYFEHLISEIRQKTREGELASIETVYIGGGTPTHAGSKNLSSLLYALGTSMHLNADVECTIEANPESLDERLVYDLWALGVNRISLGVQSFNDELLAVLGRAHSAHDAQRAIDIAQKRFENVSIDLMCGLPGQSVDSFLADVDRAIEYGITHMSIYPLSVENHTPLERSIRSGELAPTDDDIQADMMLAARDRLSEAGFHHYEVANYARKGYESRHNLAYWTGVPYLGIGSAATTMTQNAEQRMRVCDGRVTDSLDAREMAAEDLMLAMRCAHGCSDDMVAEKTLILPRALQTFQSLEGAGLVEHTHGAWRPTERGWLLGNELYGALLDLAD